MLAYTVQEEKKIIIIIIRLRKPAKTKFDKDLLIIIVHSDQLQESKKT